VALVGVDGWRSADIGIGAGVKAAQLT